MSKPSEYLNNFYKLLLKSSSGNFQIDYHRLANSVDFLSDGEATKIPRAIVARVDARNRLEVTFSCSMPKKTHIKVEFLSEALDFTQPGCKPLRHTIFSDKYPSDYYNTNDEMAEKILRDFKEHSSGVLKIHRPSKQLSSIVGKEDQHRYQVLDRITKYLHKNNLVYKNGDVKIDSTLKKIFGRDTIFVNESEFFYILGKNLKKVG
jgi:hypothetical protein